MHTQIWMHMKSKHSRRKWIDKYVRGLVKHKYINKIINDFMKMVSKMNRKNLIKGRNVSRYGYYVIRIAFRRGIKLEKEIVDLKPGKTRETFDDSLFGIYPSLGWDKDCSCPYYRKWKNRERLLEHLKINT